MDFRIILFPIWQLPSFLPSFQTEWVSEWRTFEAWLRSLVPKDWKLYVDGKEGGRGVWCVRVCLSFGFVKSFILRPKLLFLFCSLSSSLYLTVLHRPADPGCGSLWLWLTPVITQIDSSIGSQPPKIASERARRDRRRRLLWGRWLSRQLIDMNKFIVCQEKVTNWFNLII